MCKQWGTKRTCLVVATRSPATLNTFKRLSLIREPLTVRLYRKRSHKRQEKRERHSRCAASGGGGMSSGCSSTACSCLSCSCLRHTSLTGQRIGGMTCRVGCCVCRREHTTDFVCVCVRLLYVCLCLSGVPRHASVPVGVSAMRREKQRTVKDDLFHSSLRREQVGSLTVPNFNNRGLRWKGACMHVSFQSSRNYRALRAMIVFNCLTCDAIPRR